MLRLVEVHFHQETWFSDVGKSIHYKTFHGYYPSRYPWGPDLCFDTFFNNLRLLQWIISLTTRVSYSVPRIRVDMVTKQHTVVHSNRQV